MSQSHRPCFSTKQPTNEEYDLPAANDKIAAAIDKLSSQLPLLARQQALPPGLVAAHRAILLTLAEEGPALGATRRFFAG